MIKPHLSKPALLKICSFLFFAGVFMFAVNGVHAQTATIKVSETALGFRIPSLSDILTFAIRAFFAIAGLAALFYLLLGAFAWVTSGGDKDAVTAARDKIQAAVVGVILIVAVLAVIVTLEQIVFSCRICFGVSCPATIPGLVKPCDDIIPPGGNGKCDPQ